MKNKKLVIFGTGEIAELAHYYFTHDSSYEVVAFSCDDAFAKETHFMGLPLIPVSKLKEQFPPAKYEAHVALSYNRLNETRMNKYFYMKELGYTLANYVCSKSVFWPDLSLGDNCFILENQTIQPTVKIGNNVMIWSGNHLGHGCEIGDHTYLSSHICISGHTKIGQRCFIGVNSTFKDFLKIGNQVFITMGANVTKDLGDGEVIIAAQSSILKADDPLTKKLKKKYFNLEES
jgi:sugar O-acyltransferase (sialic acid O-acetyltransferase NeuD family)